MLGGWSEGHRMRGVEVRKEGRPANGPVDEGWAVEVGGGCKRPGRAETKHGNRDRRVPGLRLITKFEPDHLAPGPITNAPTTLCHPILRK